MSYGGAMTSEPLTLVGSYRKPLKGRISGIVHIIISLKPEVSLILP